MMVVLKKTQMDPFKGVDLYSGGGDMKSEVWTLRGFVVAVQLRSGALLVVEWTRGDRYDVWA